MVPEGADPEEWRKLEVKPSLVPEAGLGLFAREPLAAGEIACDYRGTVLTLMQCIKTADRSYVMGGFGLNAHVNAADHLTVAGRYINDNFDPSAINCTFVKLKAEKRALVKCLRDIAPGEELYASYGESYWAARRPKAYAESETSGAAADAAQPQADSADPAAPQVEAGGAGAVPGERA